MKETRIPIEDIIQSHYRIPDSCGVTSERASEIKKEAKGFNRFIELVKQANEHERASDELLDFLVSPVDMMLHMYKGQKLTEQEALFLAFDTCKTFFIFMMTNAPRWLHEQVNEYNVKHIVTLCEKFGDDPDKVMNSMLTVDMNKVAGVNARKKFR